MKHNFAIKLSGISKRYTIHHEKPTLVEKFVRVRDETFWALKDINLEIKNEEKIGIIGNNGCGKTTLLKIITGITSPTQGKLRINGRIASLIDLDAGFQPELTGEENIYLNGLLLGMSKKEIKRKLHKIIEFSGLGKFIDAAFYTYSNGMKLRLGFSVAVNSDPDILLLDEVLAVGDQEFQKKSYKIIQNFFKQGKTIIFISHNLEVINELCPVTLWLKDGNVRMLDKTKQVIAAYQRE